MDLAWPACLCRHPFVAPNAGGSVSNARDPVDRDKFQHPGELPTNDQAFYWIAHPKLIKILNLRNQTWKHPERWKEAEPSSASESVLDKAK